jgi:Alr-MurF fusion protein
MMKSLLLSEIPEIVEGQVSSLKNDGAVQIFHVSIDSRNVIDPSHQLFFCLKGAKFDGHEFIPELVNAGVSYFVVQQSFLKDLVAQFPHAVFIGVENTKSALQRFAAYQRQLFEKPLVAITGSNGKTIIKEWLGQLLGQQYSVAKSPKSYNSQVGVPLSLLGIAPHHQVAVMEAGISKPNEMQKLEAMLKPTIGIFTNLGTAHEEGFSSQDEKMKEKALLFQQCQLIIYRKDHEKIARYLEAQFSRERLVAWSENAGSDYCLSVKIELEKAKILLLKPDLSVYTFQVPFTDAASLENVRFVIVTALTLGMSLEEIQKGIQHLKAVEMRLTLKPGINGCLLIDDTYNNDLAGLGLALDFMAAQRPKRRKVLILSDMLEVGNIEVVHQEILKWIRHYQIDVVIGIGEQIQALEKELATEKYFYPSTESLIQSIEEIELEDDLILITGARKFGFEAVVNVLQERIHGTVLEINLNALTHNFNFFKTKIKPSTKVMVMVKAFAYGGGAIEIANHLDQLKADYLAVAYTDEGVALREHGIQLPIMVLNPMPESFAHLDKYQLEPVVYSAKFLRQLGKWHTHAHQPMKIHLDVDTGMKRLGFEEGDIPELLGLLAQFSQLKVASIYTHLVASEDQLHREFTLKQLELFEQIAGQIIKSVGYSPLIHALNSSGILHYPDHQMDMVRLGIGLYGIEGSSKFSDQLQPIGTLKTTISQIKNLAKGETVGYGRRGALNADGKIATLAIGYADGYDRRFSNGVGYVLIQGQKAPIIGSICMDMCMVDVTGIPAREGDEAIIYGPGISLEELAKSIGTIPYELLTNISSRVKRVYYLD